jgi:phage baseplate assembly protein W
MIKSIAFPSMFNRGSTKVYSDHEATASNLKLLLLSDKTSLFGDPYFGTNLKKFMFDQNNRVLRDIVIDSIYTAILQFMPQVLVERKDIKVTSDRTKLFINIKAKNLIDYQTDMYNITLTGSEIV